MNYLDRNEFNYAPSQEVVEALKNFDINKLCFYTRIYDEGKKSILSVYLSESYGIDEPQVLLGYGGEDIGEFYQFNLSSCIRQQNSLTAQFVSFNLSNLANIFYPPQFLQ